MNRLIIMVLGPLVFLISLTIDPIWGLTAPAQVVLGATFWIALWWVTEVIPIPVTSLLPIVLFPLTGILEAKSTTLNYGNEIVFLYLGGFLIALSIEKWSLHKRIALNILLLVGNRLSHIVLGFMIATALLSMWISNTATSVMMLPIGIAIANQFESFKGNGNQNKNRFGIVLMFGIAYGASIGGLATLIGTPPNLVFRSIVSEIYQVEINFLDWFIVMFPLSMFLLFLTWFYLVTVYKVKNERHEGGNETIKVELGKLGSVSYEEKMVAAIFLFTAFGWISKSWLLDPFIDGISDTVIAMVGGILMFIVPGKNKKPLMEWKDAIKLPWDIILLFGGGLALAEGFKVSGLTLWVGSNFTLLEGASLILVILFMVAAINFLTELTSNLATTTIILPILAALATSMDVHPYGIMIAATLSASCAFMLPVATPPNAVVFSSGYFTIRDMAKTGFVLNVISILLITLFVYYLLPLVWGIDLGSFPEDFRLLDANS
ncbi:SLC13 family permease [Belliella sp. DSM 111904]|uniref:SLC13 family permease n=1 Tax=Belliella filtrata TaxID=2923435 RepID=A0ABS9V382_9BACT|nr:SLC13 family permease [Belliella filtrata]MCH7410876.1 SLC13 family permease [Belliella filtrata]